MDWLNQINVEKFLLFTLVLTRVSGLMTTAPAFGSKDVPARVRVLFAFAIALLTVPSQWNAKLDYPETTLNYLVIVGGELAIGAFLGFGVALLVHGVELAGELVSYVGGMSFAETTDAANDTQVPVYSKLYTLVATAIFLTCGGYRMAIGGLLDTFQAIPLGGRFFSASIPEVFVNLVSQSFLLGIRVAAPCMIALLAATVIVAIVGRTVPQINTMVLGFTMNALLTFGVIAVSLSAAAWLFQDQIEPAFTSILQALTP